jgi:hypothetical protein
MAWPESVGTLLALGPSPAAQALRWALHGLRAALRAALQEAPDAPGAAELRGLLAELDPLLERSPSADPVLPSDDAADRPRSGQTDSSSAGGRWLPLVRTLADDPRLRAEGQVSPIRAGSDDEAWNDIQGLLLRVPAALAGSWRQRCLKHAQELGARPDESRAAMLPLPHDEVIYPGLSGVGSPDGWGATGLRSAAAVALDARVKPPSDGSLRFLAGVVSSYLWFSEHDPQLCHCLKGVFRFGITPMQGEQRERYVAELLRLWERLLGGLAEPAAAAPRQWCRDRLREFLDLDEAIHSLVHQPPAAPDSWWGRLQAQARETLFQVRDRAVQAGCAVHLQVLGGSFAEINRLAPDSLQVDFGVPGEVAACLRVWARIDGEEIKGRVLYRPPQEEP